MSRCECGGRLQLQMNEVMCTTCGKTKPTPPEREEPRLWDDRSELELRHEALQAAYLAVCQERDALKVTLDLSRAKYEEACVAAKQSFEMTRRVTELERERDEATSGYREEE